MKTIDQPVVTLQNVSKRFGRTQALDNVTMQIPEGVVFALLGENGAGKTTMIRILTGFTRPDSGTASVLGFDSHHQSLHVRRQIGYVSDAPALYDWMKPEEIGWFTSAFYDQDFSLRYLQLMAQFDLPTGTKIKHLSKGQRAKVALALATAHDPKLLILDEPTSGLDPMVRRQFLESMVDRAATGRTVLLSSHQISEVERVADWVAIVHAGRIKIVQPLEVLKSSTSIITATLDHSDAAAPLPRTTANGSVLTELQTGRQVRWVVTGLADDWKQEMEQNRSVNQVHSVTATLEEIFVAVCDDRASRPKVSDGATA